MNAVVAERVLGVRLLHRQPVHARKGMAGELADILFDDVTWAVRYFVIDDLGPMPRRDVLVEPRQIELAGGTLSVQLSREELKQCPDLDANPPVYLQYDMHGVPRPADPHLRSAEIMLGFSVRAHRKNEGRHSGRLTDVELDPERWSIASLIVDTGVWLPGKRRVIAPHEVRTIDWIARCIELG